MKKTYLDASVLLRAARGDDELSRSAIDILCDPEREFVSSPLVRMELLPLAVDRAEIEFYETYFDRVSTWAQPNGHLMEAAIEEAQTSKVTALDAIHLVIAAAAGCEEFITAESRNTSIFTTKRLKVIGL
ncbi:MAG TPA: PIN domain-containing protein [Bryobacteraceae bacterium]